MTVEDNQVRNDDAVGGDGGLRPTPATIGMRAVRAAGGGLAAGAILTGSRDRRENWRRRMLDGMSLLAAIVAAVVALVSVAVLAPLALALYGLAGEAPAISRRRRWRAIPAT